MSRLRAAVILSSFSFFLLFVTSRASAQAAVSLSPTTLNLGYVTAGQSSQPQNVTLTNTGNATLSITLISITGADPQDFSQTNNCGTQVNAGAQCTIAVIFKPTRIGTRTAALTITDNASGSPQSVPLTGTAQTSPLSFTPPSVAFPDQLIGTTSAQQTITVSYIGATTLNITSIATTGANAGDFFQTNTCGSSLAPQSSCTITVTFTPSAAWTRSAGVFMTDSAAGSPQVAGLSGSGTSGGVASLSTSSLTFATQLSGTTSGVQSVTLTNTGTAAMGIQSVAVAGDYAQTNNCGSSLAVSASCTVNVTFTPSWSGKRAGWVTLNLTDPAGLQTITLTGAGTAPSPLTVRPRAASVTPTQTQQYTARLSGVQTTNVSWTVDGIPMGNTTVGTISTAGLYTPPSTAGPHTITAINNANANQNASVPIVVSGYAGTLTYHNDNLRSGLNSNETALTAGNVNPNQFGKLFSRPVDGYVYAQPLWVPSVNVSGQGVRNVVFVATEHDSVYAFDADRAGTALWHTSFINPAIGITTVPKADVEVGVDLIPEAGITATPVIDAARGVLFVLARTKEVSGSITNYVHRLHALDITTGNEMPGSPMVIGGQVAGKGYDSVSGVVTFAGWHQNNRAALLLLNGVVYVAFAALEDIDFYHGWVFGYDQNTLAQVSIFNDTPNGSKGGIWQGGGGLLADSSGNIFLATGNGTFDANKGGRDYGTAFLKLSPNGGTLSVADYFTPFSQKYLNLELINGDLASAGPLLLPDQNGLVAHLAMACGKSGTIYLMNRDNLGHNNPNTDQIQQALYGTIGLSSLPTGNYGTPAYSQGQIYIQGVKDPLKQFTISQSLLSAGPNAVSPETVGYPGTNPVVSSNGELNAIAWTIDASGNASNKPSILRAYDAANVAHEIYDSTLAASRDKAGPAVKFSSPTVANGKVYVGTQTELDVYGLLP
jgi:hypothetical protein